MVRVSEEAANRSEAWEDDLLQFARLIEALDVVGALQGPTVLALGTKMYEDFEISELVERARHVASTRVSTLRRETRGYDEYTLVGEKRAWIKVEHPDHPGCGYDVRLSDDGAGLILEVYTLKEEEDDEPVHAETFEWSAFEFPGEEE